MSWSLKIARIAGINIYVHITFLLLVAWFSWMAYTEQQTVQAALNSAVFVLAVFGIVVLHELGHALSARWFGIQTKDITLFLFGGVARLERMPDDPKKELVVALAGPAVNVVLAGLCYLFLAELPNIEKYHKFSDVFTEFMESMLWVNVALAVFNMIPAFPMDGGRVLRAILAVFMDYYVATQVAAFLGQALAIGFGVLGLMNANYVLVFVALFVWMAASQEANVASIRAALGGVPVYRAMIQQFESLSPQQTLAEAGRKVLAGFQQDFPVVDNHRVVGLLLAQDIFEAFRDHREGDVVADVMITDFATADPHEMLESAFRRMQETGIRAMPVLYRGELKGILTPDNISEYLHLRPRSRSVPPPIASQ